MSQPDPPLDPYCARCRTRHSGSCAGVDDPVRPPTRGGAHMNDGSNTGGN